ncbi:transcriptional regulator [Bacteroidia bacterium]|nr:transcriptional regulator [Bacteroidia bacterium]
MRGMKQEVLGDAIGVVQKTISTMEKKEKIDDETLQKIAEAMDIPVEAIKNFDEEKAINIISNTFNEKMSVGGVIYNPTFNPVDKVVELYDQIIQEKDEKIKLLERLLQEKI